MSDEQTELLRAILAELKANGEAYKDFRTKVLDASARENVEATKMRAAWYAEVGQQQRYRRTSMQVLLFLVACIVAIAIAVGFYLSWKFR